MDYLWKSNGAVEDDYVDIFAIARGLSGSMFDKWDAIMYKVSRFRLKQKDNRISQQMLDEGHDRVRVGEYRDAFEKYNQSLCFAEKGNSGSEWMAYANRAKCFMQMKQYTNALIDIQQTMKFKDILSSGERLRLHNLKLECCSHLNQSPPHVTSDRKLSFAADKNILCMADVLEIAENEEFGRHIVAKCDIDVDKVVIVSDIFASVTVSETLTSCSHCNKIERNLIACANCPNAMFCIDTCSEQNGVHQLECGSIFQLISGAEIKLPVQTILMAINMFPTVDALMDFVRSNIRDRKIPDKVNDLRSRYALFLKLFQCKTYLDEAYQVYTTLMSIQKVKHLFDTEKKRNFLMHLTIHHTNILRTNGFRREKRNIGTHKMTIDYVCDVISLLNHSCSPNLFNYSKSDDINYCVTVRPIRKGSQVFINYLGNNSQMSKIDRQKRLQSTWDFVCKCEKCEPEQKSEYSNAIKENMVADESYQYIRSTCQRAYCRVYNSNSGKRQHL